MRNADIRNGTSNLDEIKYPKVLGVIKTGISDLVFLKFVKYNLFTSDIHHIQYFNRGACCNHVAFPSQRFL